MMDYMAYERKMNSIYDMVGEGKYKAGAKAAATLLTKYRGDAQLTAVRAFCLQQMGQGGEAVQLARTALSSPGNPPCAHSMGIATRVLTNAGRAADALPAWRATAAAHPADEELQEGLFQSAAGSLEYAALQAAAVRLMKLKNSNSGSDASSAGEKLSASWAAATATALAASHARNDSEVGPMGKAGLARLARAMVDKLERESKGKNGGGSSLTSQQLSLVRALRGEDAEGGGEEKGVFDDDAVSLPDAFSDLKRALSRACREALKAPEGKQQQQQQQQQQQLLDAVSSASRAFFERRGGTPGAAAAAARVVSRAVRPRSSAAHVADAVSVVRAAVSGAREAAATAKTAAAAVSAEDFSAALLGFDDFHGDGESDGDEEEKAASQYRQSLLSIVPLDALTDSEEGEKNGFDVEAAIGAALLAVEAHVAAGKRKMKKRRKKSSSSLAGASDHLAAAFLLAEACCSLDPLDPRARLAAASLAGLLGDAATACRLHGEALGLKHVLADSLASHLLLPALLACGDARGAAGLCGRVAALHSGATAEIGGALKAALSAGGGGGGGGGSGDESDDGSRQRQACCSGNFGVALSLAKFASRLSKSHERKVAAVSAATARVEAAAATGGGGGSASSSSSPAAVAAVAAAAAEALADLAAVYAAAALPNSSSSTSSSSDASAVVFTDDFSPRPRWLPPPHGDVRLAVRRWWEDDGEGAKKRSFRLSPPWWTEHGAASSESIPEAKEWRLAASAALRERARLPGRLLAALELKTATGAAAAEEHEEVGGERRESPARNLSDLPGEVERALWAAADAVAAVAAAGAANGEEENERRASAAVASALSALSAAAEVFSSSAEAVYTAIKEEEGEEEEKEGVLSLGSPSTSGVALALAHAAALAAVVAASWKKKKEDKAALLPDALLPGISELASASKHLASTLVASLAPPRASAAAIEERLSASEEFSRVLRWVRRGGGGGGGGGGGDGIESSSNLLDVREALSRLVAGQGAAASAAATTARGAAEVY